MVKDSPLGKQTDNPDQYSPGVLHPIPRADSRDRLGVGNAIPFRGVDIWNAWELTWLDLDGQPHSAVAEIRVPAESPNIVESKSLKLYLNSFAMSRYATAAKVAALIGRDLQKLIGAAIDIRISELPSTEGQCADALPGECIDNLRVECSVYDVDAGLLAANATIRTDESLHSHSLRTLCPVTAQPDIGSVLIDYSGAKIDPQSLLRYIVSFRCHSDYHESCVERMFVDIFERCSPQRLSVYARYQRRGGIDINPFRSTEDTTPENLRLWRQ